MNIGIAIITLTISAILAFMQHPVEMGIWLFSCVIVLAFLNLDKIKSFKASPHSIEMELKAKIEETEKDIKLLKELAINTTQGVLTVAEGAGRWGGVPDEVIKEIEKTNVSYLKKIGASEDEILKALTIRKKYEAADKVKKIKAKIFIPENDAIKQEFVDIFKIDENLSTVDPIAIECFIGKHNLKTEELNDSIVEYKSFLDEFNIV